MKNHDTHNAIERALEKKYREKDRRKRKRMKVSGKSVFTLQRVIHTGGAVKKLVKLGRKKRK